MIIKRDNILDTRLLDITMVKDVYPLLFKEREDFFIIVPA